MSKNKKQPKLYEIINDLSFNDYFNRLRKIALSLFEWVNLPDSMNSIKIEKDLFYNGQCAFLKGSILNDDEIIINTNCSDNGHINIYGLPTKLNCYAYNFQTSKNLYVGLTVNNQNTDCILVQNNWDRVPTSATIELFAYRLANLERTIDVNINAQKTPVLIAVNENKLMTLKNLYLNYEGNSPVIFADSDTIDTSTLRCIETQAPYLADKLFEVKKEIWNEALTFLGINNIMVDKKERLITDEANSNNELINLNLQSYLAPRQLACEQFNELFGFKGTENEISVRVRSDLHNIIKNAQSIINDYKETNNIDDNLEELT